MLFVRMFSSDKTNRKHACERNETKYDVSIEEYWKPTKTDEHYDGQIGPDLVGWVIL